MAGQKKSILNSKGLVLWLTGLTILYQVFYQVFMWRAIGQETHDEKCDGADHTAGTVSKLSPDCLEVQLFRKWQGQTPEIEMTQAGVDMDSGDSIDSADELMDMTLGMPQVLEAPELTTPLPPSLANLSRVHAQFDRQRLALLESQIKQEADLFAHLGVTNVSMADGSVTKWAQELEELRSHFQASELQAGVADLRNFSNASFLSDTARNQTGLNETSKEVLTGDESQGSLMDQINKARMEMCSEPRHFLMKSCVDFRAKMRAAHRAARDKIAAELPEQLAALDEGLARASKERFRQTRALGKQALQELCRQPHHHERQECVEILSANLTEELRNRTDMLKAYFDTKQKEHAEWESQFVGNASQALRELCNDPQRRNRKDCTDLFGAIQGESRESSVTSAESTSPEDWSQSFKRELRKAQREMCMEPHRRDREDCVQLLMSISEAEQHEAEELKAAVVARAALRATIEAEAARHEQRSAQRTADLRRWETEFLERHTGSANLTEELQNRTGILKSELAVQKWGHEEWESQFVGKAQQTLRELCNDPLRRNRKDCVDLLGPVQEEAANSADGLGNFSTSEAWSQSFKRELRKAQHEMCMEPHRRDREDCVQLLKSISEAEQHEATERKAAVAARAALRNTIQAEAKYWAVAEQRSFAQSATGSSRWEKEFLERYNISASGLSERSTSPASTVAGSNPVARTSLRQGRNQLHWSNVAAWSSASWLQRSFGRGRGRLVLEREDLDSARWSGMLPKVACITAIRSSLTLRSQMKYFVDSFHQQTYEGPSQLVLVYHHKDRVAAEVARLYADGSHIKAVAAQDDSDEFPSVTALRFGAWSAEDAQVVVHWDFEAWHHPQRLSLQARALAYSARPGCVLKEGKTASEGGIRAETLAGEAQWMQQNWHPLMNEQFAVLQGLQQDQIVQVSLDDVEGVDR